MQEYNGGMILTFKADLEYELVSPFSRRDPLERADRFALSRPGLKSAHTPYKSIRCPPLLGRSTQGRENEF